MRRRAARGRWRHTFAAVDLGTNNCRLLVARPSRNGFRVIDAFSRIVRLGEGLQNSGRLSDLAMDRTISALKVCAGKMRRRGVTRQRNVATAACRAAANCGEFIGRVAEETGIDLDIITSGEEARLAVAGCAPLLDRGVPFGLVFDIGGGSTELTWLRMRRGHRPQVIAWTSVPTGVVTLAEAYGGDRVSSGAYAGMVERVRDVLCGFEGRHRLCRFVERGQVQMLGTSGTVTTLGGVHLDLSRYDRRRVDGLWLSRTEARDVSNRLRDMSYRQRAAHPCIGHDRADLVVAGCAILEAICQTWRVGGMRVADRGVREGVLDALMRAADREAAPEPPDDGASRAG